MTKFIIGALIGFFAGIYIIYAQSDLIYLDPQGELKGGTYWIIR